MEKKFYQDNFEQLLKEAADNFRMYPSKRVWHGIYNSLHPGRRWPSLVIWLLLISSVAYIGVSNKNHLSAPANNVAGNGIAVNNKVPEISNTGLITGPTGQTAVAVLPDRNIGQPQQDISRNNPTSNNRTTIASNRYSNQPLRSTIIAGTVSNSATLPVLDEKTATAAINEEDKDLPVVISNTPSNTTIAVDNNVASTIEKNTNSNDKINIIDPVAEAKKDGAEKKIAVADKNSKFTDKEWIEDYAFHNKPSISNWKARASYQVYITPSVGYRSLYSNTDYSQVPASFAPTAQNDRGTLSQVAAINMEAGVGVVYGATKNWNLKLGVQFNYTNYSINAFELRHPTMTTLLLNDLSTGLPVFEPRSTNLANDAGVSSTRLNNNSYQISIPIGADIRLAGKDNLKWYAGATIQPTYVVSGHSFLVSADMKYYVPDNSYLRKWNLNAGIETFVSYKTKGGLTINAGPQLRYQILSSQSRQYSYTEKLYNIGVKIGIVTRF